MHLSPIEYIGTKPKKQKKGTPFKVFLVVLLFCAMGFGAFLQFGTSSVNASQLLTNTKQLGVEEYVERHLTDNTLQNKFLKAVLNRTTCNVKYDPKYYEIAYPMGDIPADKGVCTDVIIRAYRAINIDLQALVHEDMKLHYDSYPKNWELKKPDTNIDHRRVPNLQNFFARNAKSLLLSKDRADYRAGDIVTWKLSHGATHIGIVVPSPIEGDETPWIVHNIGIGPQWENGLFNYKVTGHYRYAID